MSKHLWVAMDIYGYLWLFTDIYGYLWISMDIYGYLWISMGIYWYLWICMELYGYVWHALASLNMPKPNYLFQPLHNFSSLQRKNLQTPSKSIKHPQTSPNECQGLPRLSSARLASASSADLPARNCFSEYLESKVQARAPANWTCPCRSAWRGH